MTKLVSIFPDRAEYTREGRNGKLYSGIGRGWDVVVDGAFDSAHDSLRDAKQTATK